MWTFEGETVLVVKTNNSSSCGSGCGGSINTEVGCGNSGCGS